MRESEGVVCVVSGIVVVVCGGLLTGVSSSRNGETHVYQGSPWLVSSLGCPRVYGRRAAAAAAAVVHVEEENESYWADL